MRALRALPFVLAIAACDRAPAEPQPPVDASTAAPKRANRCMRETPSTPPPAVPSGPDPACPPDPAGKPPTVPMGKVSFPDAKGAPVLETEMMTTESTRERGLMYRRSMPDAHGMLFVFDESDEHSFWMKNTCIPLDMLFVADDGFVTGILENVPTMNEQGRGVPCKVKYVLEVNAGFTRKYGIKAGQRIVMDGVPAKVTY
jgi:hypothetical protein